MNHYSFRQSAFAKTQTLELCEEGINVHQEGQTQIHIPYRHIRSLRFRYLSDNAYRPLNYCCTLYFEDKKIDIYSTTYKKLFSFEDQATSYIPFVKALFAIIKKENPACIIYRGQKPALYYGYLALIMLLMLSLFYVYYVLEVKPAINIYIKIFLVVVLLFYFFKSLKTNKPGLVVENEIPRDLLPNIVA